MKEFKRDRKEYHAVGKCIPKKDSDQLLLGKPVFMDDIILRRPRLDALRDSWYDLDAHYDALETRFWQFYPRMMAQASRKAF